jgi:hypothetical protein
MNEVLPFLHPFLGGLALLAMMQLGAAGLQARQGAKGAHNKRKRHAKQGPWIAGAMALAALTGVGTVVFVREDLEPVDSWHFWAGWLATLCMLTIAFVTPRRFRRNQLVKNLHPAVGVVAMLVGVVVLLVGIELLP